MICGIEGKIISIQNLENCYCVAVQTNGGICFSLKISHLAVKGQNVEIGNRVKFLSYLVVRENCFELFGFFDEDEREIFKMLISVSGIGPNFAISVLSKMSPVQFSQLVVCGNEKALCCCKGIGQKTASRIVLELKNKIKKFDLKLNSFESASLNENDLKRTQTSNFDEAVSALLALGYDKSRAIKAVYDQSQDFSVEQLVKNALKMLTN